MAAIRGMTREASRGATVVPRPFAAIGHDTIDRWMEVLSGPGVLESPFYHPTYAEAAADVGREVEVGVIEQAGEPVGFVPYERSRFDVGASVGRRLCDLAGALVRPDVEWDPADLTKSARLRVLRLRHVPSAPQGPHASLSDFVDAPFIDLRNGFDTWRRESLDSGSRFLKQIERRRRKIERQMGPLRLVWNTDDDEVFESLLTWKNAQRDATNSPNVLLLPWARQLVERLRRRRTEGFEGVVSALYAGDVLCAAHFGIRTWRVLHYWVPAYNVELSDYSPGLLALREIAREASARGIERIDFGPGEERFKLRASTGAMRLGTLTATTGPATRAVIGAADRLRVWSRESSVGDALRATSRAVTRGAFAMRSALRKG
jgi:CelD/BcsL family acetyltransferase involved in cellulose biosynthesis